MRTLLCQKAANQVVEYSQYIDMFDSRDWKMVQVNRDINTKLGLAFSRDEITIMQTASADSSNFFLWSFKNKVRTQVSKSDFTNLEM